MREVLAFSQSSLMLLHQSPRHLQFSFGSGKTSLSVTSLNCSALTRLMKFPTTQYAERISTSWKTRASVVSDASGIRDDIVARDAKAATTILLDYGGGIGGGVVGRGGGGGGGGGGGRGDDESDGNEDQSGDHGKKGGMSMSQKVTLGYAALVGIGGLMGFLKGGSNKSLIAGGVSACILYYVYTLLPSNPALASSIGVAISASLLGVMGSRFKKSGKIFPAGIVSLASLVMTGGYLHGILRSLH